METDPKPTNESNNPAYKGIAVSPSASVYKYTILLRFDGAFPENGDPKEIYLLRFGDYNAGEPSFVVEPVGVHKSDIWLRALNTLAELKRMSPDAELYPDALRAIARYLTEDTEGEIFVINKPASEPPPPDLVD